MILPSVVIDGVEYAPVGESENRIGIAVAITTHNRNSQVAKTVENIRQVTPAGTPVIVVDDASDKPVDGADYRFPQNVGIARAKNKALELLEKTTADHWFLLDDDIWPTHDGWWKPYVDSPEPHLMWAFQRPKGSSKNELDILYQDEHHVAYHATRGCMLYVTREVAQDVGGLDPEFGQWGWEHVSWSDRIHNRGWTTWRYADAKEASDSFYSMDQQKEIQSTAKESARKWASGPGFDRRMEKRLSTEYIEFRDKRDVILTCLFNSETDPQRGSKMKADWKVLEDLRKSVEGRDLVVITDCLTDAPKGVELVPAKVAGINPYFARWQEYYRYLRDNPDIHRVWCVDGTDVRMLREPFDIIQPGRLYTGYEPTTCANEWIVKNHPDTQIQSYLEEHRNDTLLNAGLLGGVRDVVMSFCHRMTRFYYDDWQDLIMGWETKKVGVGDMGAFQVVAGGFEVSTGPQVCTVFKQFENDNGVSIWAHK